MLVVFLLFCGCLFTEMSAEVSVQKRIEECVKKSVNIATRYKNKNGMFSLHYGDAGLEVFNSVHSSEIKQINSLASCVQSEDANTIVASAHNPGVKGIHAGSNVTYMTGIFQSIFPNIQQKLITAANFGFRRNRIEDNMENYGIRSVQYVSFEAPGIQEYKEALKNKTEAAAEAARSTFVIHSVSSHAKMAKAFEEEFDPDADESMMALLTSNTDTSYYLVIALSERADFVGGEILVSKTPADAPPSLEVPQVISEDGEEEDGYDDEEDEIQKNADDEDLVQKEIRTKHLKYTKLSRFTPDKGSIILIQGGYDTGTRPLKHGSRNLLVIEFWKYADAPIGTKRLRVEEAQPLQRKTRDGEEL